MIDLCADLGGGIMVLGGSKERSTVDGCTVQEAIARVRDGLAGLAPHAAERGVMVLLEPLAPHLSNVINTLDEVVDLRRAGSRS